jgi:hypothetical protein
MPVITMTNGKNPSLLEIVTWNCHGILQLQKKQYCEAIACFSVGLGGATIQARNILNSSEWYAPNVNLLLAHRNMMLISVELSQEEQGPVVNEGENFDFALYKRALHLSCDEIENVLTGSHEVYYERLLRGLCFYNIGLAHHLEALETCNSNRLLNAMYFYGLAYETLAIHQLLLNEKNSQQSPGRGSSNLAFLALANNTAHIHAFCRNVTATKLCSEEIVHRLLLAAGTSPVAFHEIYSEFVLNVAFFWTVDNLPAPAA